jgi:hypothetical protein
MTVEVQFPHDKLRAAQVMFHPQLVSQSGGVSVTGVEQIGQSSAGRWTATLSFEVGYRFSRVDAVSRDADSVLCWRAILALLEGRSNTLIIGPYDELNAPAGIAGTSYGGDVPHSDDADFDDDSEYTQSQTPARVAAAVAVGATAMTVDMAAGHAPEAGQYFSVLDRMYLIKSAAESASVADRWSLSFWPPVRVAVTAAQVAAELAAEFDRPQCKMRLAQDGAGQLTLQQMYRGSPSVDLVEAN